MENLVNIGRSLNKQKWLFLSYFTVFFIILAVYITMGVFPFGPLTLMKIDLYHNYAPLINEFRNVILEHKSLIYSWQGGLGSNFLANIYTLLLSPFTLLSLFFPTENVTELFVVMFLIKIPCSAVTFFIFMRYRHKEENLWMYLFSIMYALCSFVTAYYTVMMWLDTVIILPIVCMGLHSFIHGKSKGGTYVVSLTYSILTSFYTAVFICIFAACYFVIEVFLYAKQNKINVTKKAIWFALFSILSGGLAGFVIIPILLALPYTGYMSEAFPNQLTMSFSALRFLIPHYFGVTPSIAAFSKNVPNVYNGVLSFILLPFYFINSKISLKEKILAGASLVILFLSCDVNVINYILHGFHFSAWYPHRFSFIYSFLVLILAYKSITKFKSIPRLAEYIVFGVYLVIPFILAALYPIKSMPKSGIFTKENLYQNLILIAVFFVLLIILNAIKSNRIKRIIYAIVTAVVIFEAGFSTYDNFMYKNDGKRNDYIVDVYQDVENALVNVNKEREFSRTEFYHFRSQSDPELYGYNGINTFTTFVYHLAQSFSGLMGFNTKYNTISMGHPTALMNSVYSIKYLINRDRKMPDTFTLYNLDGQYGKMFLYENPYVLPLGFMTGGDINQLDALNYIDAYWYSYNTFDLQNDFAKKAASIDKDLFTPVESSKDIDVQDLSIKAVNKNTNAVYYEINDGISLDAIPTATVMFYPQEDKWTYIHLISDGATRAHLYVDDRYVLDQAFRGDMMTLDAGYVTGGSKVRLVLDLNRKVTEDEDQFIKEGTFRALMAQMDFGLYEEVISKFKESPLNVTHHDGTSIIGDIDVKESGLLFTTIPYDNGWSVWVDGIKARPNNSAMGKVFMQLSLSQGYHHLEFYYHEEGLTAGILISIISLIILILTQTNIINKNKNKRLEAKEVNHEELSPRYDISRF